MIAVAVTMDIPIIEVDVDDRSSLKIDPEIGRFNEVIRIYPGYTLCDDRAAIVCRPASLFRTRMKHIKEW